MLLSNTASKPYKPIPLQSFEEKQEQALHTRLQAAKEVAKALPTPTNQRMRSAALTSASSLRMPRRANHTKT